MCAHKAHGRQTVDSGSAGQTKPDAKAADCPQARNKAAAHRQKNAGTPGTKANRPGSGRLRKSGQPGTWRGTPSAEKPLRAGKIRVRSFACPEGPCEPGPPKNRFAVFGWHGLFLLRVAHCAEQKGAPPPFIPCKLFEKSLTKNFTVLAGWKFISYLMFVTFWSLSTTSCAPPSTMLTEDTSVSFAFFCSSGIVSAPQLHIVERTLLSVRFTLSFRLPA